MSTEQRHKYKAEFNQNYAKYMKLHNVLDQVSKRFSHLEGKLKHAPKGSEEFKVRFYTIHDIVWIVDYCYAGIF